MDLDRDRNMVWAVRSTVHTAHQHKINSCMHMTMKITSYEQRRNMVEIVPGGDPSDIFSTFCRERYFPTSRILKFISSMMVETAEHPINMTGITS